MNWEPSDPEEDDIPLCHSASLAQKMFKCSKIKILPIGADLHSIKKIINCIKKYYRVGMNILNSRLLSINIKIPLNRLNLRLNAFKI